MEMTPAEAKALARSAYIFVYPLVVGYGEMFSAVIDTSSDSLTGGFGSWLHERHAAPNKSDAGGSNTTFLYSSTWVDTRPEPWILQLPAIDADWFHAGCISDLWGFAIDEIAPERDALGSVMVSSLVWDGEVPDDIDRVVRGDSAFTHLEFTVRMPDTADPARVGRIERGYLLDPLSTYLGRPAPAPAPNVRWQLFHSGSETGDEFWSLANFALSLTTPHSQDREMLARIARIGVVAGQPWAGSWFSPDVAEAIGDGMDDAVSDLMRAAAEASDPAFWVRSRIDTDRDYFNRALGSLRRVSVALSVGESRGGSPTRKIDQPTRSVVDGGSS